MAPLAHMLPPNTHEAQEEEEEESILVHPRPVAATMEEIA